jgi:3-isopropylmalate/(R)-2-methylmalate dehydratase large subunit
MGNTATEKMLLAASDEKAVSAGDTIEVDVDISWIHETQVNIFIETFEDLGGVVWDTDKAVFMIDHFPNPTSSEQADQLQLLHEYAAEKGVEVIETGIKHQAWRSLGLARPGAIMAGPDSHTPTAGALGAFASPVGPTDTAIIWQKGKLWLTVPETIRFDIEGELDPYVTPRDIGFYILEQHSAETDYFAESRTVEYAGPTIEEMGLDGRQTLCNMGTEMGVTNAYIEPDETLRVEYLDPKVSEPYSIHRSDEDADFERRHTVDVDGLRPKVAYPHSPSNIRDVEEAEGIELDQLFLGSCANGHLSDLQVAAGILEGREISDGVDFIVTPATDEIRKQASADGILDTFVQAGARVSSGYCSACPGYEGVLAAGERCLATSTRNYRGRMGHRDSEIYLASPATVAASAITGEITDPTGERYR